MSATLVSGERRRSEAFRRPGATLMIALLAVAAAREVRAWGTVAHERVAAEVPAMLPSDAEPLLRLGPALMRHAMDAEKRQRDPADPLERHRHHFDLDAFSWLARGSIPDRFATWERRHGGERARARGALPWAIAETHARLVQSLRARDGEAAGRHWADLCHYLADAADPLRCTAKATPEMRARIGAELLQRYQTHLVLPSVTGPVRPLRDPFDEGLKLIRDSQRFAARMLTAERAAAREGIGTPAYSARLWHEIGPLTAARLGVGAEAAARFGYSAWVEAGRPEITPRSRGAR
ncbi:MAG TPA: hypothetical protein VEY91_12785 [Candidatus Limnocylindria bacterium]|nr:hypothetical protein [Candidatus Limnocylindria bacterium]